LQISFVNRFIEIILIMYHLDSTIQVLIRIEALGISKKNTIYFEKFLRKLLSVHLYS
jgi:hypothetical protein